MVLQWQTLTPAEGMMVRFIQLAHLLVQRGGFT
jgi:hypothetical protein